MNPVLNKKTFSNLSYEQESMTINGVVNKSFILWLVLAVGAYFGWAYPAVTVPLIIPAMLVALVLAIIVVFKKTTVPVISPIYAFCEGLVLGAITLLFEKDYPGIAFNAIFLTITVLFCMLAAFKAGFIKATGKFRLMVAVSTIAICLLYVIELILSLCGVTGITFITASTPLGIAFSVFVVIIASLNLIIDFDMIEQGVSAGAPKYMEWYGAFALMITIVWLYLEILRLLSKIRN
jgi:uncharacterized YccA/Bax inhibitor family protein